MIVDPLYTPCVLGCSFFYVNKTYYLSKKEEKKNVLRKRRGWGVGVWLYCWELSFLIFRVPTKRIHLSFAFIFWWSTIRSWNMINVATRLKYIKCRLLLYLFLSNKIEVFLSWASINKFCLPAGCDDSLESIFYFFKAYSMALT